MKLGPLIELETLTNWVCTTQASEMIHLMGADGKEEG